MLSPIRGGGGPPLASDVDGNQDTSNTILLQCGDSLENTLLCCPSSPCEGFLLTKMVEIKEEISDLKMGMQQIGHCLGLDWFPPAPTLKEKVPILNPSNDEDRKPRKWLGSLLACWFFVFCVL